MIVGMPVLAQNPIAELGGSTYREKAVYAVYDLQGTTRQADAIEGIVLDAIRTYARNAQVRYGIPPSPYPDYPCKLPVFTHSLHRQNQFDILLVPCAKQGTAIRISHVLRRDDETAYDSALFPYMGRRI